MRVTPLTENMIPSFLAYAARYGPEHDESYLPDARFRADAENPTVVLLDAGGAIAGAASLMVESAYRAAGKARFRLLHALEPTRERYGALVSALLPAAEGLGELYLFLPEGRRATTGRLLESLGFRIERYSWYLRRCAAGMPEPAFSGDLVLRPVRRGVDEAAWAAVVNAAFAALKGHIETTPERVRALADEPGYREEGMLALWQGAEMVGTVQVMDEEGDGQREAFIGALAVLPAYQRRGLGRNLLRAAVALGRRWGLEWASLSVNAENERAAELYFREGFEKVELYICYSLAL